MVSKDTEILLAEMRAAAVSLATVPRGSKYLIIKESGLKDHVYYGFWALIPQ